VVPTCGKSPFYSLWWCGKKKFFHLEYNDLVLISSPKA